MPIVRSSPHQNFPAAWRAIALLLVGVFALLAINSPVNAQDKPRASGAGSVRTVLAGHSAWMLLFTDDMPLPRLGRWSRAPATIQVQGANLSMTIDNPKLGVVAPAITATDSGITFTSSIKGQVALVFDPGDSEHPFKGQRNGTTYWLIRQP